MSFAFMLDEQLAQAIHRLERKVAALRLSTTAIGHRLLAQYQAALDAARAEVERRRA